VTEVAVTSALPGRAEAMLAASNVIAVLEGVAPPTPVVRGR